MQVAGTDKSTLTLSFWIVFFSVIILFIGTMIFLGNGIKITNNDRAKQDAYLMYLMSAICAFIIIITVLVLTGYISHVVKFKKQ